jgi:hypothetical protein
MENPDRQKNITVIATKTRNEFGCVYKLIPINMPETVKHFKDLVSIA